MADKKYGQKRVCPHCEKKFYDLNKKSPFKCFFCGKEIVIEEDLSVLQTTQPIQQSSKNEPKDEFADIENEDNTSDDDGVISLDDAALEEEQDTKN